MTELDVRRERDQATGLRPRDRVVPRQVTDGVRGATQEHRIAKPLGRRQQQHRSSTRVQRPYPRHGTGRRVARRSARGPGEEPCREAARPSTRWAAPRAPAGCRRRGDDVVGDDLVNRSPRAAASSSWASGADSPLRSIRRMPSKRTRSSGVSRMVTSDATRSAPSRRPTNDSAIADSSSSHCASSTRTSTGCSRAASATRLRTARPTRNGSRASCCALPSTASSAPRCGSGSRSTRSRSGSASWCTAAYPKAISDSTPTMRMTRKSDATSTAYWTSADFPMPAGPANNSAPATPRSASPSSASMAAGRRRGRREDFSDASRLQDRARPSRDPLCDRLQAQHYG